MVLDGRTQRLDEEHILLAAVRLQLHLDAVIRKSLQLRRQQRNLKLRANLLSQSGMSTTTEDGNRTQRGISRNDLGRFARRLWQTGHCRSSRCRTLRASTTRAMDALLEKRARRSIRRRRTRSCSRSTVVDEALFLFVTHDVNPRAKSRGALRSRQRKEPYVIALLCRRWLCISLAPNLLSIPSPMVSPPGWRQNCFTTVQFSRNMDYIIKTS